MRAFIILLFFSFLYKSNAQMILSGTATGSCDCYELTNAPNQSGSIWSPGSIDLTNELDFTFEVNLGADDVWGADGMMFALRQSGTTSGGLGNGLGYSGISPSVGIEIDTWNSSPTVASDIDSDHLGMNSNGTVEHDLVGTTPIANIEDGLYHTFQVTWDPVTFDMEIILDGTSIFTYTGDLVTLFFGGNPNVKFGWSGGTGGVDNIQSVCMYRDAAFSTDVITACVDQIVTFTDESTSDLIYNSEEAVTWDWDFGDGTFSTDQNPTHSFGAIGVYTVSLTITDVSGCSSTETFDITITAGLDIGMTHTDITCFGVNDGTGTATPATGTGPYTYLWDDMLAQITETSTDLAPNVYNVVVTDALGCVGSGTVTIVEPTELIIDSSISTNASCGMANGTITVTASGGSPALEYSIDGGATFQPTGNFTGLVNTSYDVVVRDANGCLVTTTTVVGIDSPIAIDGTIVTPASCGPADGTITVSASSGVLPYQYSIDGGATYQASNFFNLLGEGIYTVEVLDAAGCSVTIDVEVLSLSTVVIDAVTIVSPLCDGGTDGSIDVSASSGLAPYTYSVDGGTTFSLVGSFTGLNAGVYDIEVLDANGCNETSTATIVEPTAITLDDVLIDDVSCEGLTDGEFELVVSGGTPDYIFSNDGGATTSLSPLFTGLVIGTYDIVVEDANGCLFMSTVDIDEPELLIIDDIEVTDVSCNGLMDGEVTINASGGTLIYQYRIDGGAFQVSPTFTGLGGGALVAEVMDLNGCTATLDAFLDESDPLVVSLEADTIICLGGIAELCPVATGGTEPYSYVWDGDDEGPVACLTTTILGEHNLQVVDINGCTSDIVSQSITQYEPLSVFSSSTSIICPGDEIVISGEASGDGPTDYTYIWTNDVDGAVLDGAVHNVNPEETTIYTLTVGVGCENIATTTVTITTYDVPAILISSDVYSGCQALEVNLNSLTDPMLVATTNWDLGDGSVGSGSMVNHTYEDADCYDITVDITTVDGCESQAVFIDTICVWQNPIADFSYLPTDPDLFSLTVDFDNESENGDIYNWSFGDGSTSNTFSPSHIYPELGNKTYLVELEVVTNKGCLDYYSEYIKVDEIVLYYIPNAFTPDGNPINDSFTPVFLPGFNPSDYSFKVFNRWGELLFESYNPSVGWDGSYNGVILQDGSYTWQVIFRENTSDKKHVDVGHFLLLK